MRYLLLLGLLFSIQFCAVAQVEVEIDFDATSLDIVITTLGTCDACLLGSVAESIACQCADNCREGQPSQDRIDRYNSCMLGCANLSNPNDRDYCEDGCELILESETQECIDQCGDYDYGTILFSEWTILTSTAQIPFNPLDDQNSWEIFAESGIPINANNGQVEIPTEFFTLDWDGQYGSRNTCVILQLIIYVESDINPGQVRPCFYLFSECNIIG